MGDLLFTRTAHFGSSHRAGHGDLSQNGCGVVIVCLIVCLSCLVLSCLVLSCLVLSCLVLSCLVLSCLVLSCLVLSCLVLSCLVLSCLVVSCRVVSCRVLSRLSCCCSTRIHHDDHRAFGKLSRYLFDVNGTVRDKSSPNPSGWTACVQKQVSLSRTC